MKNKEIGTRLKSLRKNKGLEQQEVAKLMGYKSDTTISKWENGKNLPNGGKLAKLASIFNTSTDYILHGEAIQSSNSEPILDIYNELTPPRQQKVYHYAEEQLDEQQLEEHSNIYMIHGRASAAGSAIEVDDNDARMNVVNSSTIPNGADEIVKITGDSMEPLIKKAPLFTSGTNPPLRTAKLPLSASKTSASPAKKSTKTTNKSDLNQLTLHTTTWYTKQTK